MTIKQMQSELERMGISFRKGLHKADYANMLKQAEQERKQAVEQAAEWRKAARQAEQERKAEQAAEQERKAEQAQELAEQAAERKQAAEQAEQAAERGADCYEQLRRHVCRILAAEHYRKLYAVGGKWDTLRGARASAVRNSHGLSMDGLAAHAMQDAFDSLQLVELLGAASGETVEYSRGEYVLQRKAGAQGWINVYSIPCPMVKGKVNMLKAYLFTLGGKIDAGKLNASSAPWIYTPTNSERGVIIKGRRLAVRQSGDNKGQAFIWNASFKQFSDKHILPHLASAVAYCADAARAGRQAEYRVAYKAGLHVRLGYAQTLAEKQAAQTLAERRAQELAERKARLAQFKQDREQLMLERELRKVEQELKQAEQELAELAEQEQTA